MSDKTTPPAATLADRIVDLAQAADASPAELVVACLAVAASARLAILDVEPSEHGAKIIVDAARRSFLAMTASIAESLEKGPARR